MTTNVAKKLNNGLLIFGILIGVLYPIIVIIIEIIYHLSASTIFDPIPTLWHKLLVFSVVISNLLLLLYLKQDKANPPFFLNILATFSIGISAFYSIVYLPFTPFAFIAIIYYGIGLLLLAPLASFIVAIILYLSFRKKHKGKPRFIVYGLILAIVALIIPDIQNVVTKTAMNLASESDKKLQQQGINLLRNYGDKSLLLRYCYSSTSATAGPVSYALYFFGYRDRYIGPDKARAIYYRVTGEAFNNKPVPFSNHYWSRFEGFEFDSDQGGSEVGGRVKDLTISYSNFNVSINTDDAIAYAEWILEFENNSRTQREARLQIQLPPNAVISKASLWINGEEKQAAFAGREKTRQAYESVVSVSRDPLLVTTQGKDRILAQAFPINPDGGKIKFRLGITIPLQIKNLNEVNLLLPAIVNRNFNIEQDFLHHIVLDGKDIAINENISDIALSKERKVFSFTHNAEHLASWTYNKEKQIIMQRIIEKTMLKQAVIIVLDGSIKVKPYQQAIIHTLESISVNSNTFIGLVIAGDSIANIALQPWNKTHKEKLIQTIKNTKFIGGQDNFPALSQALEALNQYENTELLWIHAPQPVLFTDTLKDLQQVVNKIENFPDITLYALESGPNKLLNNEQWTWRANTLPKIGKVEDNLTDYLNILVNQHSYYNVEYKVIDKKDNIPQGSQHIARLWAYEKVFDLLEDKEKALQMAVDYQLVTPVSGAVVLESQQQYEENALNPVDQATVPTIPEPKQIILLILLFLFMLWLIKKRPA